MNNLIRSELLKQRTVRLPLIAAVAAAIAGALTAIAIITTAGHAGNPPLDRHSLTQLVHGPFAIVAGAALLLGILGTAGEFRHQTITSTLLVAPRRGRLLTAKVLVHAGLGAGLALVACAVSLAVSIPWLSSHDVPLAGLTDLARVVAGSVAAYQAVRSASSPGGPARVPTPRCGPRPDVPSPTRARSSPPARGASSIATSRDGRYAPCTQPRPTRPITRLLYLAQGVAERPPPGSARGPSCGSKP
jgi:hypothetical protein